MFLLHWLGSLAVEIVNTLIVMHPAFAMRRWMAIARASSRPAGRAQTPTVDYVGPRRDGYTRLRERYGDEDAFVEALLARAKALKLVEGREGFLGIVESEKLAVYGWTQGLLWWFDFCAVLGLCVGQIVRGTRGNDVRFRNYKGWKAVGEFVELASNSGFLC